MAYIGLYRQTTEFTTAGAGTSEWCRAEKDGREYFIKKFQNPVYPSAGAGLPERKYRARVKRFHAALNKRAGMYRQLAENDTAGVLVVPEEVFNYQYHICTASEYVVSSMRTEHIYRLSEWQRLVLMRTLVRAIMDMHGAGIVHSDLKPDNVIITRSEGGNYILKLIDFDESFYEEDAPSDADEVHGDPAFFAPEAYELSMGRERRLDRGIDIFALGIILHYFWCGKLPEKPVDKTIGEYVLEGGEIRPDRSLPPTLRELVLGMLAAEPAARMDCGEVYEQLGTLLSQYPVTIRDLSGAENSEPGNSTEGKKEDLQGSGGETDSTQSDTGYAGKRHGKRALIIAGLILAGMSVVMALIVWSRSAAPTHAPAAPAVETTVSPEKTAKQAQTAGQDEAPAAKREETPDTPAVPQKTAEKLTDKSESMTVVIKADDCSKVYGDSDPELTVSISGSGSGSVNASSIEYSLRREPGEDAGTYRIIPAGAARQGDLELVFEEGIFTIERAPVTVQAANGSKTYGEDDPAFRAKVTGLKNGEGNELIRYLISRDPGEDVGVYDLRPYGEEVQGNYVVQYKKASLHINRAILVVVADDQTKQQGEADPQWTATVKGLRRSERAADVLDIHISRQPGENPGVYTIKVSGDSVQGNYNVRYRTGTLTILPAEKQDIPAQQAEKTGTYEEVGYYGGKHFVVSEGRLCAYDAASHDFLWSIDGAGKNISSIIDDKGYIYISAYDGPELSIFSTDANLIRKWTRFYDDYYGASIDSYDTDTHILLVNLAGGPRDEYSKIINMDGQNAYGHTVIVDTEKLQYWLMEPIN